MTAHLSRDSFESLAKEVELNDDAVERVRLSITASIFFDDCTQFKPSVEGGFGHARVRGDGGEGNGFASFDQLSAG